MKKRPFAKSNTTKSPGEIRDTRNIHNIIKTIHRKLIANIKFNGEKLKAIPLKSGIRLVYPHFPYLFNIVLKVLVRAMRQLREIKRIYTGKEKAKESLFPEDMVVYISDPKSHQGNSISDKKFQ